MDKRQKAKELDAKAKKKSASAKGGAEKKVKSVNWCAACDRAACACACPGCTCLTFTLAHTRGGRRRRCARVRGLTNRTKRPGR